MFWNLLSTGKTFSFSASLVCRDGPSIITYMGTNEYMDIWSLCSINWRWLSGLLQTRRKISEILQVLRDALKLTVSHEKNSLRKTAIRIKTWNLPKKHLYLPLSCKEWQQKNKIMSWNVKSKITLQMENKVGIIFVLFFGMWLHTISSFSKWHLQIKEIDKKQASTKEKEETGDLNEVIASNKFLSIIIQIWMKILK